MKFKKGHKINVGRTLSEAHRRKISMANIGKHNNKGENNPMYRKHHTEESKRKMSKSKTGIKLPPFSEEHRRKLSEANMGNKYPPITGVTRKKLSKANQGRKHTNEAKMKISETRLRLLKEGKIKPLRGNLNPNWRGGVSIEPYTKNFNEKLKREIRQRDGGCMLCNLAFEDLKLLKRQINVHHINYNKQLSLKENLIILCNPCHSKTNFNRPHWINFFQSLLSERYGYEYTEQGVPIINIIYKK